MKRLRTWWRGLPLMRAFALYTVGCLLLAGAVSLAVMLACMEGYSYLARQQSADHPEVDSGPYVYDASTGELVPAISIDLGNGFGDRVLFLGLRGGVGRASAEDAWGETGVYRADTDQKVVYATLSMLAADDGWKILDWGGNYTEADYIAAGGNPYDPEPIAAADLAAYDVRERAERLPVATSLEGALGDLADAGDNILASNVAYYVTQNSAVAEPAPMLALRLAAGFAPFVVVGVVAVLGFRRFYRMRLAEPLGALHAAADRIAEQDLDFSVGAVRGREFGALADAFERMRASLERAQRELWETAEERRRLNAAFAHDLRTPVTVLKGTVEMMEADAAARRAEGEADGSDGCSCGEKDDGAGGHAAAGQRTGYGTSASESADASCRRDGRVFEGGVSQARIAALKGQVERLESYAQAMTGITKLEDRPVRREPVAFAALAGDLARDARALSAAAGRACRVAVRNEAGVGAATPIEVDASLVAEVLGNLMSNACRYAREQISVEVRLVTAEDAAGATAKALLGTAATDRPDAVARDILGAAAAGASAATAATASIDAVSTAAGNASGIAAVDGAPIAANDTALLEVTVTDDGPGFTPEALRRGCEAFFSEQKSAEHFGLGLAVASMLARLHDGGVELACAEGGGARVRACFTVGLAKP